MIEYWQIYQKLIWWQLMSSWKEYKIGDVMDLFQGLAINSKTKYLLVEKSNLPLLRIKDLQENTAEFFVNESEVPEKCIANENDLIFTRTGIVGLVFMGKKGVVHNNCFRIVPKIDDIFLKFYYYYFNREDMREYLTGISAGSVQPDMNHSIFKNEIIPVPPFEEQKAIAEVLSSLDDKIDLLHRQNQTLESLAQTLFRQWFIEEAKEEWEIVTLGDLGKVVTGKTPSTSNEDFWGEDIPFITPTDFKNYNKYAFSSDRKLSTIGKNKVKNSVLPKNSILVTCIGSDMGKVVITKNECVTNQQINSLVLSNDDLLNEYVFQYLKNIYPLLRAIALGGTTMPIINKTDFENIEILLPTDEVLERFQSITLSSNQKIIENTKQIQTLENLRDTLLPKLLSGEVRVKI